VSRPPADEAPSKPVKRRRRVRFRTVCRSRRGRIATRLGACRLAESGKSRYVMHGAPRAHLK
jgi:hypothetical protein